LEIESQNISEQEGSNLLRYRIYIYLLILVLVSLVIRVSIFGHTQARVFPDSVEYITLSKYLRQLNFAPFFRRTPGYPLVLALLFTVFGEGNLLPVVACHMLFSALVPVFIFLTFRRIASRDFFAFLTALFVTFDLYLIGWDTTILTESIATLLVVLCIWLFVEGFRRQSIALAILTGLALSFLGLTRPLFSALFFVLGAVALLWLLKNKTALDFKKKLRWLIILFAVPFIIMFSWAMRNFAAYGVFGTSTSLGCNLTNLTGNFIEVVQPQNRQEGTVLVLYVRQRNLDNTHVMTIWKILPEAQARLGLSEPQVSNIALSLSKRAILKRPGYYLFNVLESWYLFWGGRKLDYFSPPTMMFIARHPIWGAAFYVYENVLLGTRFMLKYLPVLFLLAWLFLIYKKRSQSFPLFVLLLIGFTVIYTAVVSSFLELGENPRYRTPVEPLILGIMMLGVLEAASMAVQKRKDSTEALEVPIEGDESAEGQSEDSEPAGG